MGQMHPKVGLDVGEDRTLQEPPFWQRGPGPVWQGFMYWQYSPTCMAVQLQPDKRTPITLGAVGPAGQTVVRAAGIKDGRHLANLKPRTITGLDPKGHSGPNASRRTRRLNGDHRTQKPPWTQNPRNQAYK
jgi:hypothetical protein